jgi:hypothetical protein
MNNCGISKIKIPNTLSKQCFKYHKTIKQFRRESILTNIETRIKVGYCETLYKNGPKTCLIMTERRVKV